MVTIDEINRELLSTIGKMMNDYEDASFGKGGQAVIDGYFARVTTFEIEGELFHVTLQHLRSKNESLVPSQTESK